MSTDKFGRYEIRTEVGRGGMATVYHAYDPRFERDVAIKVLPHALLHDPQFRIRFEREAKTIGLLEHPAIVPVYDFGEEDGQPYIVMRFMSGGSLKERIDRGNLPVSEAIQIVTRLAPALDAAHARGIIHRDLKPGNVLFDQYGNAFLSDFGIARLAHSASAATLTQGAILGTPAYMSPEQIQGEELDGRADIYSLGVILYEMISGLQPYKADTPHKVMMMHLMEQVPDLRKVKADISPVLDAIIGKAMAKSAADRYATAAEMASALANMPGGDAQATQFASSQATMISGMAGATVAIPHKEPTGPVVIPPKTGTPEKAPEKKGKVPVFVWGIGILAVLVVVGAVAGGGILMALNGGKETPIPTTAVAEVIQTEAPIVAIAPTDTPQPTPTDTLEPTPEPVVLPTSTPEPTLEPTPTDMPSLPIIGGADKVAFISANDIWMVNIDGSDPVQLTNDRTEKMNLNWTPDGNSITYISGLCVKMVEAATGKVDTIVCFNNSQFLESFEISPKGDQVAITVDRELYVVPYDLEKLSAVRSGRSMASFSTCPDQQPWSNKAYKSARWSSDQQSLAVTFLAPVSGRLYDMVRVLDLSGCYDNPPGLDEFPANRFTMSGYTDNPIIFHFSWNDVLFALNSFKRNGGFGDLYIYNSDLHKLNTPIGGYDYINPIDGVCCYRDPTWSPDGRYLMFAFQDIRLGAQSKIELYYVPYGDIMPGASFTPLPLPEILLTNSKDRPDPALRPAR